MKLITILKNWRTWQRDSHDLKIVMDARKISRQAALNALAGVISDRRK